MNSIIQSRLLDVRRYNANRLREEVEEVEELGTRGVPVVDKIPDVVDVSKRRDDELVNSSVAVARVEVLVVVNPPGPLLEPPHVKLLKH